MLMHAVRMCLFNIIISTKCQPRHRAAGPACKETTQRGETVGVACQKCGCRPCRQETRHTQDAQNRVPVWSKYPQTLPDETKYT